MLTYQESNNIKDQCCSNADLFATIYKSMGERAELKAVLVYTADIPNNTIYTTSHMVVEIDEGIVDPSFETSRFNDGHYFETIGELDSFIYNRMTRTEKEKLLRNHLILVECARRYNNGDEYDRTAYYLEQQQYVLESCIAKPVKN